MPLGTPVVPEVNADALKSIPKGIVANPNCSTAIALMGLYPLHLAFGLKRFFDMSIAAGDVDSMWPKEKYFDERFVKTFDEWKPK